MLLHKDPFLIRLSADLLSELSSSLVRILNFELHNYLPSFWGDVEHYCGFIFIREFLWQLDSCRPMDLFPRTLERPIHTHEFPRGLTKSLHRHTAAGQTLDA